jgi:signal transduction histidine kinase
LTRSDREADLESWLENIGVANAYRAAPPLVDLDLTTGDRSLIEGASKAGVVVELLRAATELSMLVHEVREGASRLSAVVQPLKSYSYLDQAPVQEVDVVAGLEDTLMILSAKVTGLTVRRDYAPNLPRIEAYGSELNQVWTNLIDNAADAIRDAGTSDGEIAVRVFATPERLVVEIADNGPGIPDEIRNRIFDAFFTTKPPGRGTGLGLEISYGIVVNRHRGEIEVESQPGRTVFRVLLPLERPA